MAFNPCYEIFVKSEELSETSMSSEAFGKKSVTEEFDSVMIKEEQMSDFDEKENNCEQFDFYHTEMVEEGNLPEMCEVKKELIDEHFRREEHITSNFDEKETSCEQFDLYHTKMVEEGDLSEIGEVKKELICEHSVSEAHITSDFDNKDFSEVVEVKNEYIKGLSEDNASDAGNDKSVNGDIDYIKNNSKKHRVDYSKAVRKVLKEWLHKHLTNPYPSDDEKLQLANKTGLTVLQVHNWFTDARRREFKSLIDTSELEKNSKKPREGYSKAVLQGISWQSEQSNLALLRIYMYFDFF